MVTHCSDSRSPKRAKTEPVDYISQLPQCIIASILYLLPYTQAAATMVLSKAWEKIWLDFHRTLDFDSSQFGEGSKSAQKRFVKFVSDTLASHQMKEIDEFRVKYGLDKSYEKDIDEWLNYAFAKKVKMLELDFSSKSARSHPCRFPGGLLLLNFPGILGLPSWLLSKEGDRAGRFNFNLNNLSLLTSLRLSGLNVTATTFHYMFNTFPSLERLKVHNSKVLSKCSISEHSSCVLRHLEITDCTGLEFIRLENIQSLISLKVTKVPKLEIRNVPGLMNVCLSGLCWNIAVIHPCVSICAARMEVLTFQAYYTDLYEVKKFSRRFELKQLNLTVLDLPCSGHTLLVSLIESFPELEKLVLKLVWTSTAEGKPRGRKPRHFANPPWSEEEHKECVEELKEAMPRYIEFDLVKDLRVDDPAAQK